MTRCQHCKKLTHSEDLFVEFDIADMDKIHELVALIDWQPFFMYANDHHGGSAEYGKLKCGDIWIHFVCKRP